MKSEKEKIYIKLIIFLSLLLVFNLISQIGVVSNQLAVKNNGDRMPVLSESYFKTKTHFSFEKFEEVNYPILTDVIPLGDNVVSIGDLLMNFAVFGIVGTSIPLMIQVIKLKRLRAIEKKKV